MLLMSKPTVQLCPECSQKYSVIRREMVPEPSGIKCSLFDYADKMNRLYGMHYTTIEKDYDNV